MGLPRIHSERAEAESKDPAKLTIGLMMGFTAWPRGLRLLRCSLNSARNDCIEHWAFNVERWMFRLYSRVEDVACPITYIDRPPPGCFTAG